MATIRYYFSCKPIDWEPSPRGFNNNDGNFLGEILQEDSIGFYIQINHNVLIFNPPRIYIEFFVVTDRHYVTEEYTNTRRVGEYQFNSAQGTCEQPQLTKTEPYQLYQRIQIKGASWEDVQELDREIKSGLILPTVPYDEPQVEPLPTQFFDWLKRGWRIIKRDVIHKGAY